MHGCLARISGWRNCTEYRRGAASGCDFKPPELYAFATFQSAFSTLHPAFSTLRQMPDDGFGGLA